MFEHIYNDVMSNEVNVVGALFKLVLAMALGAAVGFERRRKGQIAGVRTFALICMGATLAMLISIYIPQVYMGLKNGDPGRIAAQVVSGVGFLGAGAIIQMKGSVRGLTTAAGIWMSACIGLAIGAGMYLVAIIATFLIIFVLVYIERYEHRANFLWESKIVRVKVNDIVTDSAEMHDLFNQFGVHISDEFLKYDYDNNITIINYIILAKRDIDFKQLFEAIHEQYKAISITLTNEVNI